MSTLRLGTRGSPLALYQATTVASLIQQRTGDVCEIVVVRTSGDRLADAPLAEAGGKRLFVKEIEEALLARSVDLAVHSSKDMPTALPSGLEIGAVLPREDPRDVLVLPEGRGRALGVDEVLRALGNTPRIGTSSVRRIAQLASFSPGARFQPIRGNLDTRLRKLDAGEYDALVLAAAGLRRLERGDRISAVLPVDTCVPAPGQGIIAVEIRTDDGRTAALAAAIGDREAAIALTVERTVVERLGGGCQMPIAAYAHTAGNHVRVVSVVLSLDGARAVRAEASGPVETPEHVGTSAADDLLAQGAGEILADAKRALSATEGHQQ